LKSKSQVASTEGDDELITKVRARDSFAFETLYDRYARLVYAIAVRMLSQPAAAEDITQAVFLKIWSAPQSFRGGNFPGWIARVVRNRCLDELRSRAHGSLDPIADAVTECSLTEDTAFADIDAEQIRAAISRLPADQRELIELGFYGGLTQEEMSRRTQTPLGTVKSRIRTGLQRLRAEFEVIVRK